MIDAVIFSPNNALDFQDVRSNVIRIPEVSLRLSEVEDMWGQLGLAEMNIHNYFLSDDAVFLKNIKLKKIAATIVQLGLYDRYLKKFGMPRFILGSQGDLSALKIVIGKQTLNNMLFEAYTKEEDAKILEMPQLKGVKLVNGLVFSVESDEPSQSTVFRSLNLEVADYGKLILHLIEECSVRKIINIGPGHSFHKDVPQLSLCDTQVLDSIDLDPMLNWFWPGLQASAASSQAAPLTAATPLGH